jgi:hypothetical protein
VTARLITQSSERITALLVRTSVEVVSFIDLSRLHHSKVQVLIATTKMDGRTKAQTRHVGVVGTGIAGLRCAGVLLEKGVRVTMLEARDRIGGRVCHPDPPSQALLLVLPLSSERKLKLTGSKICQSDGLGYSVDLYILPYPHRL